MSRGRVALVSAGAVVLVSLVAVAPASAKPEKGDLDAVLADLDVTATMVANSTFDLTDATANATFDIKSAHSEFTLERTEIVNEQTVVTLTSDLLFEFGSSDLTGSARAALTDLAKTIPQDASIAVDGHTDSIGGDDVNIPLSQARAQTVADALAAARPDLVLTVTGHGSAKPIADNTHPDGTDDPIGRALNRRVTLTYATG
ncbi:MAG: OmpA family protein [Micrococcales bacterium]|nr:OmpA family protein [Micrococcales bacterium]